MNLRTRITCCSFLLIAAMIAAGCGSGGRSGPKTVGVSGIIYLDGKPLPDAIVTFSSGEFAGSGRTNSEGHYELAQGAVPGDNKVTVTKWKPGEYELNPEEGMDEGQFEAMGGVPGDPAAKKVEAGPAQLIPEHYSDPDKSDLTYKVPEEDVTNVDFRLQSKK